MAKRGLKLGYTNSWVDTLSLKQLRIEAIQRGCPFEQVSAFSVLQMQSWVYSHREDLVDKSLLVKYDSFIRGYGDEALGLLGFNMAKGQDTSRKIREYPEHTPGYVPRTGTKKELTQELVRRGLPTKEIINKVFKEFGTTNPQSIKSWCSRFRKQMQNELDEDK